MNKQCEFRPWSKHHREATLREARTRNPSGTASASQPAPTDGGRTIGAVGRALSSLLLAGAGARGVRRVWP